MTPSGEPWRSCDRGRRGRGERGGFTPGLDATLAIERGGRTGRVGVVEDAGLSFPPVVSSFGLWGDSTVITGCWTLRETVLRESCFVGFDSCGDRGDAVVETGWSRRRSIRGFGLLGGGWGDIGLCGREPSTCQHTKHERQGINRGVDGKRRRRRTIDTKPWRVLFVDGT